MFWLVIVRKNVVRRRLFQIVWCEGSYNNRTHLEYSTIKISICIKYQVDSNILCIFIRKVWTYALFFFVINWDTLCVPNVKTIINRIRVKNPPTMVLTRPFPTDWSLVTTNQRWPFSWTPQLLSSIISFLALSAHQQSI